MAELTTQLPYWDDFEGDCWDTLALEGQVLPGVWSIEGECERDIDQKKSGGKDGARLTDKGYKPAEITLKGELSSRAHWRDIQEVLRKLHPRKKGGPSNPISADHPALAVMGIHMIYIKGIRPPEAEGGKLTLRFTAYEWIKPVAKKPTNAGYFSNYTQDYGLLSTRERVLGPPAGPDTPYIAASKDEEFNRLTDPNYKPSDSLRSRMPKETPSNGAARIREQPAFVKAKPPSVWDSIF
jgi:hypothetical protein